MAESSRLLFIETRDGVTGAKDFALRTLKIYRSAVLHSRKRGFPHPHHASLPQYRREFITSYLSFKHYLKEKA